MCVISSLQFLPNRTQKRLKMAAPAGTALETQLKQVVPQIQAIIDDCKLKPAGIMQPSVDKIVKMATESGLATKRIILARHCGVHPDNRGGSGVDPFNAQNQVLKISKQGYSDNQWVLKRH